MKALSTLPSLLNVRPGEGRLVSLLLLNSALLGVANNFVQTAAFTLFLVEFDARALSVIYIINAGVVILITYAYLRLDEHLSFARLSRTNLGFLLLAILAFWLGLTLTEIRIGVFALPVLFQVVVNFGNIEFWSLVGRLFTVRQGKRLFGLAGSGLWIAIVITGFLISPIVGLIGTTNLLLLGAAGMAGALIVVSRITRTYSQDLTVPAAKTPTERKSSATELLRNRYAILIFTLVIVWWTAFFLLENLFYGQAASQFSDEGQLASFLGIFSAVLGVFTLFMNFVVTGPTISRYGVRISLFILPIILVLGTGSMAVVVTVSTAATVLFVLTVLTKLLDMGLGFSIDRSASVILFQPLPANQRSQIQAMVDGVFQPLANGLAGATLLLLGFLFASSTAVLIYALFAVVLAWLGVAVTVGRAYPKMLMRALVTRSISEEGMMFTDGESVAVLQQGLESPHPGAVIYSLNMLEALDRESLASSLPRLLSHPASEVRHDAVNRIERLGIAGALPLVRVHLTREPSPAVRGAALRTLATLGETEGFEDAAGYLGDPEPHIKRGAMVGLLRSGGIEGVLIAGHELLRLADSRDPSDRVFAAQVLGDVGVRRYHQPLVPLLRDKEPQVRRAALHTAGRLKNSKLWPLVVENLASPQVRGAATAALVAGGETVLPELEAAFVTYENESGVLVRLAQCCGRIGGDRAVALLEARLHFPDPSVRTQVLHCLSRCGYRPEGDAVTTVQNQIQVELAGAAQIVAAMVDTDGHIGLADSPDAQKAIPPLETALDEALDQNRLRLCFLLSFLYDSKSILQARDNLSHPSPEKRAYAMEVMDISIPPGLKEIVLPLMRDLTPGQRQDLLNRSFPQPQMGYDSRLLEIVVSPNEQLNTWTKACALALIGRVSPAKAAEAARYSLSAPDPLIRETAVWTLARLDRTAYENDVEPLRRDSSPQVAGAIQRLETARNGDVLMLSTIEKVIILKTVDIFSQTSDDVLAGVASLLKEVALKAGEPFLEKGDIGDCMYIIVEGQMRVHDEQRTLEYLGERDVFGEMALLDAAPRFASVTAVTDTKLLGLNQEPFFELMADRIEVARGIIRVLSGRLRAADRELNELRARIETTGAR